MRDPLRNTITIPVLASYLLAFVAGECLHHHQHQAGALQECVLTEQACFAPAGCGCDHAAHHGAPIPHQELHAARHLRAAEDARACAVCQVLAQKFLPTRPIQPLTCQELRDRIAAVQPACSPAAMSFSWHSRAPPVA